MKTFLFLMFITLSIAGAVFYLFFFVLAPLLVSAIPPGQYKNLIDLLVYIFVAYIGGIGGPLSILIFGTIISAASGDISGASASRGNMTGWRK